MMKFIHDFIFSDGSEDSRKLSVKLLDSIVELLDILLVFHQTPGEEEWSEMAKMGMSIILISASNSQLEICSLATARLHALIQTRLLEDQDEACYILGMLNKALPCTNHDHYPFFIPVIKALLEKIGARLNVHKHAPNLPSTNSGPAFFEQFQQYCKTEEWNHFIKKIIKPHEEKFLQENHTPAREEKNMFWNECFEAIMVGSHKRNREVGESKLKFLAQIVEPFHELANQEDNRYQNNLQQFKQQNILFRRRWMAARLFLFSPRGAWESLTISGPMWKISHHENFDRMRLKLTINHNFDDHLKASRLRDNYGPDNSLSSSDGLPSLSLAKEAVVSQLQEDSITDDEVTALTSEDIEGPDANSKEKLISSEKCQLVTLMSVVDGTLEITTLNVYFIDKSPVKEDGDRMDFKWPLSMLREVHLRRYNLRRSALEFFLVNQTNYFVNFSTKTRNKVYGRIVGLRPPNLIYYGSRGPAELLKASGLVQKWVQREITTFEYLMQLNTIAGRTYNDLSQYPVFPWILADYTSEELDLENESTFRDLTRPIGINNPKNIAEVKAKYEQFEDVTGTIEKFHFGTHYSNSAGVLHYMVRLEPFTSLHIDLQGGRHVLHTCAMIRQHLWFDVADRQFHSLEATWNMLMDNPNDVKELIPEFFYLPEFLINLNGFDLGKLQSNNQVVNDVILPKWATNVDDFIYQHRQALESEYVSNNLHHWIDLIFGYKQKGPAAVEALNVFYYCSYEGAVDLDAITDPIVRQATEGMINNFGQTPCQLLKEPHPKRMFKEEAYQKMIRSEVKRPNILLFPDHLKAFFIELCTNNTCAVYINVPKSQSRSFIQHGMPDSMVTVNETGIVGVHGWLPYDKSISNYFTFEKDPTLANNKTTRKISGPFQPGLEVTSKLFVVTQDAKLLISAGHWDNSIRVFHLSKNKTVSHIIKHTDIVTCLDLDTCGNHLISGSRDTTSKIWEIRQNVSSSHVVCKKPLQTLYGHNDEVTCVAIAIELDMAVSGSKDGTVNVYTVREGQYLRTLRPSCADDILELYNTPQSVTMLTLSDQGHICIHCCNSSNSIEMSNSLHIYTINGRHIAQEVSSDCVTAMAISRDHLITGSSSGVLRITEIHGLRLLSTMSLHIPITCVSLTSVIFYLQCQHARRLVRCANASP
ncbi:Neurobeachin-like protein 1 [Nymphon striatum]|nr:Neurobeachin-like protein 1 [Nymphon striatum]